MADNQQHIKNSQRPGGVAVIPAGLPGFFPMDQYPEKAEDEHFSKSVLVFNEDDPEYCELGYYDFEHNEWHIFGDFSIKLICWCYAPDPTNFLKTVKFKSCTHYGYRD